MMNRTKAKYLIELNEPVNIKQIQIDLDLIIDYCEYSKTITAVTVDCDDDVLSQCLPHNTIDIEMDKKVVNKIDYYHHYLQVFEMRSNKNVCPPTIKCFTEGGNYNEYTEKELQVLYDCFIQKHQLSYNFRFTSREAQMVKEIMNHPLLANNYLRCYWKRCQCCC